MRKKRIFCILICLIIVFIIWMVWSNITIGVTHYSIRSNRVPSSFDNFRIAVVSDLHNADFGNDNSQLVKQIEREQPDIIAITGDLVDANRTDIETAMKLVSQLVEIAPCYFVTGNHEAWIGEQYQELENGLVDEGVVVLHDSKVTVERENEEMQVAGLDDPDFVNRDSAVQENLLMTKLDEMDLSDDYCILLSHRPETFGAYVSEGIDLVLSGHAHGGQFRFPFIGGIVAPNQGLFPRYDAGKYTENDTNMIVSRGIGNSIIPVRFNNRPEIVIVDLVCE